MTVADALLKYGSLSPYDKAELKHDEAGHMGALEMCFDEKCKDRAYRLGIVDAYAARRHVSLIICKSASNPWERKLARERRLATTIDPKRRR